MALADPKKAKITHSLKDGTIVDSIEGHIVRMEDAEPLYQMLLNIANGTERNLQRKYKNWGRRGVNEQT